jgi:uncharacterized membrane protein
MEFKIKLKSYKKQLGRKTKELKFVTELNWHKRIRGKIIIIIIITTTITTCFVRAFRVYFLAS